MIFINKYYITRQSMDDLYLPKKQYKLVKNDFKDFKQK